MLEEEIHIICVCLHESRCLSALGEQDLIRAEKALADQEVLEVQVIELGWGDEVQWEEVVVAARAGAPLPQLRRGGRIQCAVSHAIAGLVVEPLAEAGAPRHTDGVATCVPCCAM